MRPSKAGPATIIAPRCNATCVRPFRPLRHCEFHTGWNRPFWMKLEDPLTLSLSPRGEGTFAQRSELLLQDRSKRAFFEQNFAAFRVLAAPGLLAAYFEPVLKGSRKRPAAFPVPVYRRPAALRASPRGSSGVELRAGRSLAAGPLYQAPGMPIWVVAPGLTFEGGPFRRFLIAQDTGPAIVGPQRGDVFAGMGEDAGRVAGRIRHVCEFIVLRPKR